MSEGVLYVVATPIGNLEDITPRAVRVLSEVDVIAAEDTRHSAKLLHHLNIGTRLLSVHEHNERGQVSRLISMLRAGKSIALISDAGTPLISDPGFVLVSAAREAGIRVVPVPGACAAIAALSISGMPVDRFVFEGFLPHKQSARRARLEALRDETRTLVFYESVHRAAASLSDMAEILGDERPAVLARELTKQYESVRADNLGGLRDALKKGDEALRGEFVLLVHGAPEREAPPRAIEADALLDALLAALPVRDAAAIASRLTGVARNTLYRRALARTRGGGKSG